MIPVVSSGSAVPAKSARMVLVFLYVSAAVAPCQDIDLPIMLPYDRELYEHWTDADGDCLDTRQEVLIAESQSPPKLDSTGCRVLEGLWFDPYTGQQVTDPSRLEIDHLIPLAEAHRSGAASWTPEERRRFANDLSRPDSLIAVMAASNRSKGDRDPAVWLPPNESYRCQYVRHWVIAKATWGLEMDPEEREAVRNVLWKCGGVRVRHPSGGQMGLEPESGRDHDDGARSEEPEESTPAGSDEQGEVTGFESRTGKPIQTADTGSPESDGGEAGSERTPELQRAYCEQLVREPCIDVNAANLGTLRCANGVGPVKAQAIIDYRTSNGLFQDLEDLDDVPGIGPATVTSIRLAGFCVRLEDVAEPPEPTGAP